MTSPLRLREFRALLALTVAVTLAYRAAILVVGYQVFELTNDPLALGWLGLIEAIPALSLVLFGGHVADRRDRRTILRIALLTMTACVATFTGVSWMYDGSPPLIALYAVVFVAGVARGFAEPAGSALESQVVPPELMVQASAWMSSTWMACAVLGPAVAGFVYSKAGGTATYLGVALLYGAAWLLAGLIASRPAIVPPVGESIWRSIAAGVRYVLGDQVLLGSMALDLFAVLFGGAVALLPIFAKEVLHVGPEGLGLLNAAPAVGALGTMLVATRHPPIRHAGRNLIMAVAAFGVCMIVFALSKNFWLSLVMLALSGAFDGVSVVIRRSIVRLLSPVSMRGRISAVSMIFIGSSNELGTLESGVAARLLGTVRSVWLGGLVTLAVVAVTALAAPKLRRLRLDRTQPPPTS